MLIPLRVFIDSLWTVESREKSKIFEIIHLSYIFRAFDHNGDGCISKDELRDAMTRYGHTFSLEEADEMFQEADVNGDGNIDFDEFLGMMMQSHHTVNYATQSSDCGFSQK